MASVIDAFNDTFAERLSILKFAIYGLPVFCCAQLYLKGQMGLFYTLTTFVAIFLLGFLSTVISNVCSNEKVIITANPLKLFYATVKSLIAIGPIFLVLFFLARYILGIIPFPEELPQMPIITKVTVWIIVGGIILTSYLSFAKYLRIRQAYKFKAISESCVNILINLLFFIPQIALANVILFMPIIYIFYVFHLPYSHWIFIYFSSIMLIINLVVIGNYYAQVSFEMIKGEDSDYNVRHNISYLDIDDDARGN